MAQHQPGSIWPTRAIGNYPQQIVRTVDDHRIEIASTHGPGHGVTKIEMTRADARLLSTRLVQCLEATK